MIRCRVTDGTLVPANAFSRQWLAEHVPDRQVVFCELDWSRSPQSHKHQFAWLKSAWENLPERLQDQAYAATPETLRKHALIATGFHNVTTIDCGSKAAAERVAPVLQAAEARACGYAVAKIKGPVVRVWTPESQSSRAMGHARFQESKTAIMDWIADLLGVSVESMT